MMRYMRPDKAFRRYSLVFAALAALVFAGCGAPPDPSGSTTGTKATGSAADIGANLVECFACHRDDLIPTGLANVVGDSSAALANGEGWLSGPHANNETMQPDHSRADLSPVNIGFPPYYSLNSDFCSDCHDPQRDGTFFDDLFESFGIESLGIVERPVIGCAACHGSGEDHFGLGDLERNNPDASVCGGCHDTLGDEHLTHNSDGDKIYSEYLESGHSHSNNSHIYNDSGYLHMVCGKCHTYEYAMEYRDKSYDALFKYGYQNVATSAMQCSTCHDPHNPLKLVDASSSDGFGNTVSEEYNTCTNCHMVSGMFHGEESEHSWWTDPVTYQPLDKGIGNFESDGIIYDTHFDNPYTDPIEGYVLDLAADDTCSACHDVHNADIEIHEQWARSAHGGHILEITERAFQNVSTITNGVVLAGGDLDGSIRNSAIANVLALVNGTNPYGSVTEDGAVYNAPAWTHFNFKDASQMDFLVHCQRCHTSTGFKNLISDPANYTYDFPNNTYGNIYSSAYDITNGVIVNSSDGLHREMLYCWACHESVTTGEVRGVGLAFEDFAPYDEPAGRIANVPGIEGSNTCIACHSGSESGGEISASTEDFTNTPYVNSHYLTAGGILFRTVGYEFTGSYVQSGGDYDDEPYFHHSSVGTAAYPETGENGPCAGCHMSSDEGHTFEVVLRDITGNGLINSIASDICSECHAGDYALTAQDLNHEYEEFEASLEVLKTQLAINGLYYASYHPYFFNSPYVEGYAEDNSCSENLPIFNWQKGGTTAYIGEEQYYIGSGVWECISDGALVPGTAGTGKDRMGAAFNYGMLHHEPGAYAHNSLYTKRLLFDSIDLLEDGAPDGVIAEGYINNATAYDYLNNGMRP